MPPSRRQAAPRHRKKPDPLARAVGVRVRQLRDERAFTFDAFVEECGLGRGYISELERGLVVPTITALAKLAKALEVPVADLVTGDSLREQLFEATRDLVDGEVKKLLSLTQELRLPKAH
jgi:transcriptional regulator with XRE-family HTH domain